MNLILKTKSLKYGWKAYIYDGEDLIFTTTNYYDTEEEALEVTKKYFCSAWSFEEE